MDDKRFQAFLSALEEEMRAHAALSALLERERDALLRVDMEALGLVVEEIRDLRCRMRPMATAREKQAKAAARALGIPDTEISLGAMAEALPREQADRLDALRRAFARTLESMNVNGDLTEALLTARLTAIRRNIEYLSARQAVGNNYQNAGMPAPEYEHISLMDTEI